MTATLEQYPRLRATRLWAMVRARGYPGLGNPGPALRPHRAARRPRGGLSAPRHAPRRASPSRLGQLRRRSAWVRPRGCSPASRSCCPGRAACYARFALDQTLESFLRGHVEAFTALEGVPRTILYDNLKSVVLERVGDHIRFHPRLLELAGHYHFAPQPCAVARGNEKGRVERIPGLPSALVFRRAPVPLGRGPQRATGALDRRRRACAARARTAASNAWPRRSPRSSRACLPLPEHPFRGDLLRAVSSGKTPYIRFDGNDYSIPHTLVRRPLTLVAAEHLVRLLDGTQRGRAPRAQL